MTPKPMLLVFRVPMDSFMRFLHSRDQAMANWSTMAR